MKSFYSGGGVATYELRLVWPSQKSLISPFGAPSDKLDPAKYVLPGGRKASRDQAIKTYNSSPGVNPR